MHVGESSRKRIAGTLRQIGSASISFALLLCFDTCNPQVPQLCHAHSRCPRVKSRTRCPALKPPRYVVSHSRSNRRRVNTLDVPLHKDVCRRSEVGNSKNARGLAEGTHTHTEANCKVPTPSCLLVDTKLLLPQPCSHKEKPEEAEGASKNLI